MIFQRRNFMMNNCCANCAYCYFEKLYNMALITCNFGIYIDDPYSDVCELFMRKEEELK